LRSLLKSLAAAALATALAACFGAPSLSPAINARLDQPGATLDAAAAVDLINQYRATLGAPLVILDPALNAAAAAAAAAYADASDIASGRQRVGPIDDRVDGDAQTAEMVSAGQATFAETFSGWRNNPNDAEAIKAPWARRAGIGVIYDPDSEFGTYWVLIYAGA
jgi:uncharacterized protein YkwD